MNDKMVANLGVFYEDEIAMYQSVGTDPEYRKRGICQTLVYEAGQIIFEEFAVRTVVIQADPDYHAARIYESVGFRKHETNDSLSWWKK